MNVFGITFAPLSKKYRGEEMLKFALLSLIFIIPTHASDKVKDLCICQTSGQASSLKMGCSAWFVGEECKEKVVVSESKSISNIIDEFDHVEDIKIGYVGHWTSSGESVSFLQEQIIPAIKKHDVNIEIDNTACRATSYPYEIVKYLKEDAADYAHKIKFKGNQVTSTGLWDSALPGKNNFWAIVDGDKLSVEFPKCSEFENQVCWGKFQGDEIGICHDEERDKYVELECHKTTRKVQVNAGKDRTKQVDRSVYTWKRLENNYKINELSSSHFFRIQDKDKRRMSVDVKGAEKAQKVLDLVTEDARNFQKLKLEMLDID